MNSCSRSKGEGIGDKEEEEEVEEVEEVEDRKKKNDRDIQPKKKQKMGKTEEGSTSCKKEIDDKRGWEKGKESAREKIDKRRSRRGTK